MANYLIIGGDGKQYGPVSEGDLRKWVAEGRLNAQSQIMTEGGAEWRPLTAFPEFADLVGGQAHPGAPLGAPVNWADRDYDLDIGGCVTRGWDSFKNNFGVLFGAFWLPMLILLAVGGLFGFMVAAVVPKTFMATATFRIGYNIVLQAVMALLNGPLIGGIFYIYLQVLRGRPGGIGDLFVGFQRAFLQLYLGNFVVAFVIGLCFVPFTIMESTRLQPLLDQMQHGQSSDMAAVGSQLWPAMYGMLPVLGLCMLPMMYLTVNWQFVLPLIIDKPMAFWPAMKTSWKMVHKHWFYVFGLIVVLGLINVAGVCLCCVGALFTAPLTMVVLMHAYETIFGESQTG